MILTENLLPAGNRGVPAFPSQAMTVDCQRCGSKAGQPCRDGKHMRPTAHVERARDARWAVMLNL